jgi:hypothetical protein
MNEKDLTTRIIKYCQHNIDYSCAIEVKITHEKSLPFARLEEHQRAALFFAKHRKLIHKIPDAGYLNPFDFFILYKVPAYVCVMFYTKGEKEFFLIDIDKWMAKEEASDRKSLRIEEARDIGQSHFLSS